MRTNERSAGCIEFQIQRLADNELAIELRWRL